MPRKREMANEINASSMADIAFLLLIFFLVTTTIEVDKGILHQLPPWSDEPPPEAEVNDRNVLVVLLNKQDQLLVDGEQSKIDQLREKAKRFLTNYGKDPDLSDDPTEAVISLQNDRGTSYDAYIQVQNELKAAYREAREEYVNNHPEKYNGRSLDQLTKPEMDEMRKDIIPMRLSEAEPKSIGE